jgi:hypothetical protein
MDREMQRRFLASCTAIGGPEGTRHFAIWNKGRLHYLAILIFQNIFLLIHKQQLKTGHGFP